MASNSPQFLGGGMTQSTDDTDPVSDVRHGARRLGCHDVRWLDHATTLNHAQQDHHDGDDQEDVNHSTHGEGGNQTQ